MSAIRDIRLLVARYLDQPPSVKSAILNVLNVIDTQLDAEGFQDTPEIRRALKGLESAILGEALDVLEDEQGLDDDDVTEIDEFDDDEDDEDDENN